MTVLRVWLDLNLVGVMLRLTMVLCAGMFAALLIAGRDNGQLRPGLAKAVAEGRLTADLVVVADPVAKAEPTRMVMAATVAPVAKPAAEVVAAAFIPVPEVAPVRDVVQAVEEPVFTLSALPTEAIPAAEPEVTAGGKVYYVIADSVNVRQEPSTDAAVLGKLASGEAALVVADVDGEWSRIVIEGDGIEGYVATRFLSAVAP